MVLPALSINLPQEPRSPLDVPQLQRSFGFGYDLGEQTRQKNLLKEVGGQAAQGNYLEAARKAMQGGDLQTGLSLQKHSRSMADADSEKKLKLLDFFARGIDGADTPEKFDILRNFAQGVYGSSYDLSPFTFDKRDQIKAFLSDSKAQLEREKLAAEARKAQYMQVGDTLVHIGPEGPTPVYSGPRAGTTDDTKEYDFYVQEEQAAGRQPVSFFEYQRALKQPFARTRQFSVSDIGKLSDEAGKFANLGGFISTFDDKFAGYGLSGLGNTAMTAARYGLTGPETLKASEWWQQYDRYKNAVRHDLFGSALTATEQAAWNRADINPGMVPSTVRKNLEEQQRIVKNGLKRKANALIQAGYDAQAIASAYGLSPEEMKGLGVEMTKGAPSTSQSASPPASDVDGGERYVNPDTGEIIQWNGSDWERVN